MFFNSFAYLIFLPIVFIAYWFLSFKSLRIQNCMMLIASYVFYAFWNWHFLFLLVFSTFLDYFTGFKIYHSNNKQGKQLWLTISVVTNLGFLAVFKYYNFFAESFAEMLQHIGFQPHYTTLQVILPVGISFYTFHGLSYVFDIYYDRFKPRTNVVDYSLFVSFFPLLVAGPIERATHLLPQVETARNFDYAKAVSGLRQILWGLFKKMVIADNCAEIANKIFNNPTPYNGSALAIGAIFFAIQIYGDFSGYTDIALGTARLFGFELLRNFSYPYFSRDIPEFWRRWHISLTSWFRDYLYYPLGGSRDGTWKRIRNTFIIFLVSGFWHGANWTFIVWGFLHALFMMPTLLFGSSKKHFDIVAKGKHIPSLKDTFNIVRTFSLVALALVFFRSNSVMQALHFIRGIFSRTLFQYPTMNVPWNLIGVIVGFIIIEWLGREDAYAIEKVQDTWVKPFKWSFYYILIFIIYYCTGNQQQFIYFQF